MNFILYLTFPICWFALSKARDPYGFAYHVTLGPLEFFLKLGVQYELGIENVSNCYQQNKEAYEKSITDFNKTITGRRELIDYSPYKFKVKKYAKWVVNEMENIFKILNNSTIFNLPVAEIGEAVWRQRNQVEKHHALYEKHKYTFQDRYDESKAFIPYMEKDFEKTIRLSKKLVKNMLICCGGKNIPYVKTKT